MKVLTDNKYYGQIADVIREQNGTNNTYTPPQMVSALKDLFYEEVEGVPPITFQGIGENLLDYRIDGASGGVGERTSNLCESFTSTMLTNQYANALLIKTNFQESTTYVISFKLTEGCEVYANETIFTQSIKKVGQGQNSTINVTLTTLSDLSNAQMLNNFYRVFKNAITQENSPVFYDVQIIQGNNAPLNYEPYGYKVPVVVNGKNLLKNVLTSRTLNGVTITVNQDKSINISGQLDVSYKDFYVSGRWNSDVPLFEEGTYKLIVESTNNNIPITCGFNGSYATGITGTGNRVFTNQISSIMFRLTDSMTLNNETLKIMVCKPIIADTSYEPYHEPTITNIYLDEPIEAKANIPSEYEEVEYIESTGTQYIDTNYTPVQGDDLEFKNVTINNFNGALFSAGIESYQLILLGLGSVCYYKYFQAGNAAASSFSTITNGNIKILNGNLYINNVLKVEANYGGAVNTTLNIFQRANNTSNLIAKIGEIIISNNGIIKRDFIPCYRKSDNVAGLYDLVNNVFYTNQGTGNFIVGPIKENESISLSDTNVDIPTIRGTNVLSVDTTVQPSNVYVKSRHESSYETAMRERYEEAQAQLDALESE